MKKLLSLLTIVLLVSMGAYSQAPGIFNYQGVARNSVGNVLVNKTITLRLTIHDVTAAGAVVYQESRTVVTNPFGLFNVQVGSAGASNVTGTVAGVPWGVGAKFIQVEIDPNGGTTFINIGTAQIASVPYALFATTAGDLVLPFNKTQADAGTLFKITNSGTGAGSVSLEGLTNSAAGNVSGIIGTVTSTSPGGFSSGVRGINNGTSGLGIGVYGSQNGSGWGVYGTTPSGIGVYGSSTSGFGVTGTSSSGTAVSGNSSTGIAGLFENTNGANTSNTLIANTNGSGTAVVGNNTGTGFGGNFTVNNAASTSDALRATTNGTGASWAIRGTSTGTNGAGLFVQSNAANTANNLQSNQAGLGRAGLFQNTNAANVADVLAVSGASAFGGYARFITPTTGNTGTDGLYVGHDATQAFVFNYENTNLIFGTNNAARMLITPTGIVGVNTITPATTSRMHVAGAGVTGSILERTSILSVGNLDGANGHGVIADGEWRGIWGRNTGTGGRVESSGVRGDAGGSGYTNGVGTWGTSSGTGTNNYGSIGISQNGTFNIGAYGQAPINANSWAGVFYGRVFIQDGTQGLNKIFTSDAVGNGSWQTLGAGVGIGGSGTLNYVSKWTPNGTNLGNSIIYDNAATTTIGGVGVFTANNTVTLRRTTASPNDASLSFVTATQGAGIYVEGGTDDMHVTLNANAVSTGSKVMTFENTNLNVGINTVAPVAETKLHVNGTGATGAINLRSSIFGGGNLDGANGHGVIADGEWRAIWGRNLGAGSRNENTALRGDAGGSNYNFGIGVRGSALGSGNSNYGAFVEANGAAGQNYGIWAQAPINASSWAGVFQGRVNITDGTEGAGKFLWSDAVGNASWTAIVPGGLSGLGTNNFVAKWTPSGTVLGNSQLFDDANNVNIGGGAGGNRPSSLTIWQTAGTTDASLGFRTGSGELSTIFTNAAGQVQIGLNSADPSASNVVVTVDDDNQNVGIGTTTPTATSKLEANHGTFPNTGSTIFANSDPTTNGNITGVYGRGGWYGVQGINDNTQGRGVSVGVQGIGGGANYGNGYGVQGISNGSGSTNYGLYGTASGATNNIGVYAAGTQFAAVLDGITQAGTTTSNFSTLNIGTTTGITNPSIAFENGGNFFNVHENTDGQLAFRANNLAAGTSDVVLTIEDDNLNIGINTAAPLAETKLHVNGTGTTGAINIRSSIYGGGNLDGANGHGVIGDGEWRGVWGRNTSTTARNEASGVRGQSTGSAYNSGYGVFGSATGTGSNNFGLYGEAANASGVNYAAWLNGTVRISDGTQGAGKVLTSDATGVASWQTVNVGIGLQTLSANVVIAPGGFVNITNWNTITHETGGANYNAGTGEYTITVAGVYQINASLAFNPGGPDAIDMILNNNGTPINEITQYIEPTGFTYGMNLNCLRHLNVGDKLRITAGHSGASPVTLISAFTSNNFSVQMISRD